MKYQRTAIQVTKSDSTALKQNQMNNKNLTFKSERKQEVISLKWRQIEMAQDQIIRVLN
jgi:hypothetical protein